MKFILNFSKHRVSERALLSEMMDYCNKIIFHRSKEDEKYLDISVCISTRTGGVEIRYDGETIIVIRYDERNDFYYFLGEFVIDERRVLKNRIIIENKEDFYSYFDHIIKIRS